VGRFRRRTHDPGEATSAAVAPPFSGGALTMALYRYKAVSAGGEVATGELDAANEAEIADRLRDQGLMPMQIAPAAGGPAGAAAPRAGGAVRRSLFAPRYVTRDQLIGITRELATLITAGLTLDRALEMLISLALSPPVAVLLQGIRDDVRGGKSLSQALDARRELFSRFYVNIVRAGEAGGALGVVLTRLADTMERNKELRESVKSALIYPTILVGVAAVSVVVLLIYVVPQFEQTFAQAGKALPLPTAIVFGLAYFLKSWWWAVVVGIVAVVWWIRRRGRSPRVRRRRDARILALPLIGDLVRKVEVARFARTLATLLGNGVTLLAGLSIVKETLGNLVLADALDGVTARLREGKGFGRPLADTGLYPRLASQMILVGEESGRLEEMLIRVADIYDREVQLAIKRFLAVLEPVLILSLAVLIGGIVFSILLGVMGMSELVG
jgi:general secretion pathway protein F